MLHGSSHTDAGGGGEGESDARNSTTWTSADDAVINANKINGANMTYPVPPKIVLVC